MADSPILTIPVDTSQFDEFMAKWKALQEGMKQGTPDPFAGAAASAREAAEQTGKLATEVDHIAQQSASSRMTGQSSFIVLFAKNMHFAAQDSEKVSKNIDKTNKGLLVTLRNWTNIKSLRKDALALGGFAAAGVGAVANASRELGAKNLEARGLNIKPGTADAFEADYTDLGLKRSDISTFTNAKEDTRLWKPLIAAGLSVDQIKGLDPDELAIAFARAAGNQYKGWESQGLPAAQIANARGFNDLLGNETLRAAGSWSDKQWDDTRAKYESDKQSFRIDQKTADQATAFNQKLRSDLTKFGNAFNTQLSKAAPELGHLADAATDAGINLLKWFGPKVAKLADGSADVIDAANNGTTFARPDLGGPAYKDKDVLSGFRWYGDAIRSVFPGIPDVQTPTGVNAAGYTSAPTRDATFKRLEKTWGLRAGVLDNFERQESSRGLNIGPNTNASDGPAGPFQMTKATGAMFGVKDRLSESERAGGAAQYLAFLLKRYKGDYAKTAAAYDGFGGLDKAIAKYGDDWRQHLSEFGSAKAVNETRKYLRDLEANGLDLSQRDANFANARNDANLKANRDSLDKGEQFVDMSKTGAPALTQQQTSSAVEMGVVSGMSKFLSFFKEGGGAGLRTPDAPRGRQQQSNAQAPVHVQVQVNTPPGSSTNVTTGSLPR